MQLSKLIKNPVLLFWLKQYFNLILFSQFLRVLEVFYFHKLFIENGLFEFIKCFALGFIFDSSVVSVALMLIFLITTFFDKKEGLTKNLLIILYFFILAFNVFNFLNLLNFGISFNYYTLKQINSTVIQTIISKPQFYFVLLVLVFCFLLLRNFVPKYVKPKFENRKIETPLVLSILFGTSFLFLSFPFYYYCNISSNRIINELPKNGVYCFVSSLKTNLTAADLIIDTDEMTIEEAVQIVSKNFSNIHEIKNGKIIRTVEPDSNYSKYKHVILIIMESMGSNVFNDSIAPNLFKIKNEGVYFTGCKATGPRTQMGVASLLTGVPNLIGENYYRRKGIYKIETLADYLTPLNYVCYYLHNGFLDYDNADKLLMQGGFKNLIDANSMTNYKQKNSWGLDDEALFIKANESLNETHSRKTFHVLQSLTNHEPFEIPQDFKDSHKHISGWNERHQTYYYADCMLGDFLNKLKTQPFYDSTIVFITGDHAEAYVENDLSYKVFHVPVVVLGGGIKPGVINEDCSHADIPYTILSICGYNKQTVMMGENLFSLPSQRAVISTNYNAEMNIKRNDTLFRYSIGKSDDRLFKLNSNDYEEFEIKSKDRRPQNQLKKMMVAHYKLVREYLLSGKINR